MNGDDGLFWLGFFIFLSVVVYADGQPEGKWYTHQPSPGVKCSAFFIEHKHDADCYPVPVPSEDEAS